MSNDQYAGVYSSTGAGTRVGTKLSILDNKINKVTSTKDNPRQYVTKKTLQDSELNVAKIRLVSTLPGKEVAKEVKDKAYVGFILTGVQETHSEKLEIVPLPGDSFASYFYGASPRQFGFSGILLNTEQDQWRDTFEQIYEKYLRGSVSSRDFSIVQVSYNGRIVSGWLTNLSQQMNGDNDLMASFSFSVLVSRVDMVGGTKNFTDYMVTLPATGGEFAQASLDADYAVLDPSNYNGMIDPIRTGMVIPPKRPRKSRKKRSPSCYFPALTDENSQKINTGAATNNTHINDATVCTVTERIEGSQKAIKDALAKAKELADKAKTRADLDEAAKYQTKAENLMRGLKEARGRDDVKEQLRVEQKAALDAVVSESQKKVGGKYTARALRAQKVLEDGEGIQVGKSSRVKVAVVITADDSVEYELNSDDANESQDFDPDVYDGTPATEGQRAKARASLTRGAREGKLGAFDEANVRIRKIEDDKKKQKKKERETKAANIIRARIKL